MNKLIYIILVIIGCAIGWFGQPLINPPETKTETKIVYKDSPPQTSYIKKTEIRFIRDTVKLTSIDSSKLIGMSDSIAENYIKSKQFYNLSFNHDFEPTETFQGVKVKANSGFSLYNLDGTIDPKPIESLTYIEIEPYPMKVIYETKYINEIYPWYKKAGWGLVGFGLGVTFSQIYQNNR